VAGWGLVAGKLWAPWLPLVLALQFLMGLFAALVQMSNTRLAMAIVPVMGRNHFFAIFSVVGGSSNKLAPILWGLLIDAIGQRQLPWLGLEWNRYSVFFAAAGLIFLAIGLVRLQQELGRRAGGVLEGRDIGTKVFPETPCKFFLTARPEVRARRRFEELQAKGMSPNFTKVLQETLARDEQDSTRADSPLRYDESYTVIDTSDIPIDEVVEAIVKHVRALC